MARTHGRAALALLAQRLDKLEISMVLDQVLKPVIGQPTRIKP
jgi:hypothetical protein